MGLLSRFAVFVIREAAGSTISGFGAELGRNIGGALGGLIAVKIDPSLVSDDETEVENEEDAELVEYDEEGETEETETEDGIPTEAET